MTRTCCVWCPDWPVVAARRRDESLRSVPVVVRERVGSRDLVRAASAEARAEGVTRGMRRREAEAQCPGVVCIDTDESLEARAFEVVARAVEVLTPRLVLDRPGLCAFLTRGPSRYFGGDEALAAHVHEAVIAALGEADRRRRDGSGIADGGFAARLATRRARTGAPFVVEPGAVGRVLRAVAGRGVRRRSARRACSCGSGCATLGDVAALPADAVLARFGVDGRRFHDLARGIDAGPPVLVTPPPDLVEQVELDPPVAARRRGRVRGEGPRRPVAGPARRSRARVHAGGHRSRDRARRTALAVLAQRRRAHAGRARRTRALAARRLARRRRDGERVDETSKTPPAGSRCCGSIPDEVVPADGRQLGFWGGDQAAHDRADRALARCRACSGTRRS